MADSVALLEGFLKTDAGQDFEFVGPDYYDPKYHGEGVGIAIRKGEEDLRLAFNEAIDKIRADGTYQAINHEVLRLRRLRADLVAHRRARWPVPSEADRRAGLPGLRLGLLGRDEDHPPGRPVGGAGRRSPLGLLGAWGKLSGNPIARSVAGIYTTIVRGVPELVLILLVYYGITILLQRLLSLATGGEVLVDIDPFTAGTLTLGVIYGAFTTEVFRGAFQALDRGQIEAAYAAA